MKTIDIYVLRVFLSLLGTTLVIMIGLYVLLHFVSNAGDIGEAQENIKAAGTNAWSAYCRYYALHIPEVLILLGPYALLGASIACFHQLEHNNELVPMFAVGVSRFRMAVPVLCATILMVLALVFCREAFIPNHAEEMDQVSRLVRGLKAPINKHVGLIRDPVGNVFDAREWHIADRRLVDVYCEPADGTAGRRYQVLEWRGSWSEGRFHSADAGPRDHIAELHIMDIPGEARRLRRLSWSEIATQRARRPERADLETAYHEHLAYPLTPLILVLMGIPVALRRRERKDTMISTILTGLIIALAYFSATLLCHRIGTQGDFGSPALAAWLPVVLFGIVAFVLNEIRD